jgi:hypothetical protein
MEEPIRPYGVLMKHVTRSQRDALSMDTLFFKIAETERIPVIVVVSGVFDAGLIKH